MSLRTLLRWLLGVLFVLAGLNHFRRPDFYARIMPPYLPWHAELVALSGVLEVLLGALVLVPRSARVAGWGMVALMVAVFPANVYTASDADRFPEFSPVAPWVRLPLQGVLIAWAWWCTRPEA